MTDLPSFAPPAPSLTRRERMRAWLDMWLVDHGVIRDVYCNVRRVSETAWRSAQPAPHHVRAARDRGIRTVLNLRGRRDTCGSYILEREACAAVGLKLLDFPIRSRSTLERDTLRAAVEVWDTIEYPVLMHCKSGADRAGFMAALYLFMHEGRPLSEAMGQLSIRYGHVRQSKTGVIDYFFERFLAETGGARADFLPWVEQAYDPRAVNEAFRARLWGRAVDLTFWRE